MRYDDPGYIAAYLQSGIFPKIHDDIFTLADNSISGGETCLDLCSSTGLLGRRIVAQMGNPVCAVEMETKAIEAGRCVYGSDIPLLQLKIVVATLPQLSAWLRQHTVKHVVARRCLCPLTHAVDLGTFAATLWEAGVETIVHEGLKLSRACKEPFACVDKCSKAMEAHFVQRGSYRNCRTLVRR